MDWVNVVISNIAQIGTVLALIVGLITYIRKAIKEKNWNKVLNTVMDYMKVAEDKFDNGADRKEWVLAMIKASADTLNYDVKTDEIAKLIDDLCAMSKKVNAPENACSNDE